MRKNEQFLAIYRDYETLVRNSGQDCKDVEDKSDDLTANRLRMCRNFRNYLSHQNDSSFLEVSEAQIKFMKERVTMLKQQGDILKKHVKKPAVAMCMFSDKCCDVIAKMAKLHITDIVVINKDQSYVVANIFDVSMLAISSKTNQMKNINSKSNISYVILPPDVDVNSVPSDKIVICTSDGTDVGKLIGVKYPG